MEQTSVSHGSLSAYIAGFVLSLVTTLTAFWLVMSHKLSGNTLFAAIIVLAVIQLYIQLRFFLHLGREAKPRWNLTVFAFMLMVIGIIVIGSLWIMQSLNYQMGDHPVTDQEIMQDEGIYRQ